MNIGRILVAAAVVSSGLALAAQASVIVMKNGRTVTGKSIEWREDTRDYLVINEGASMPVPEDQIASMNIDRPAELDQAKKLVSSGQYAQAIPVLDGMIKAYRKLSWDVDAMKLQAQCYVEMNDLKKASEAMDRVFTAGGTMPASVQMNYWKALQKTGDIKQLERDLNRTLGTGPSDLVAAAYLIRGNSYLQDGNQDAALSDFLKIVTLFKGEKAVQPEALYNAAELLEKANAKDPRAADLRKILLQDYKTSEFAGKLK
jgi:tetratricopeptide (TPR) repeat protein